MVTTRSKTAQTHPGNSATKDNLSESKFMKTTSLKTATPKANSSRKRKSIDNTVDDTPATKRRQKAAKHSSMNASDEDAGKPITIHRAPVLQLWAASVAHLSFPNLSWEMCLSAGSAVSSICAVAKGRSIGTVPVEDDSEAKQAKRDHARSDQRGHDEIEVMHFKLRIKDGLTVVGSDKKGKPGNEKALRGKFEDEQYRRVKDCFEEVLAGWKGLKDDLNKEAFHMYERFRPDVSKGKKGWGRKGDLRLEVVRKEVERERKVVRE